MKRRRRPIVPAARVGASDGGQHPVDRTPRVSDDPQEIAEVRKLHEQDEDAVFEEALEELLQRVGILRRRGEQVIERRKDRARAELKRMMEDAAGTDERRCQAARALVRLGDHSAEDFLLDAVRTGPGPRRVAALDVLDDPGCGEKVDLARPDRARLILTCLDDPDPDVVREAVNLCIRQRIPGAEAKLVRLLEDGRAKDPRQLARELAEVLVESPESIPVVLNNLFEDRPKKHDFWPELVLKRLLNSPDPAISEPVRAAFLRYNLGFTGKLRYDSSVVRDLCLVADRTTIPVLEDILDHAQDSTSRAHALHALARLDPEHTLERALDFVRSVNDFHWAISTFERLASEENADRIIDAFLDIQNRNPGSISLREAMLLFNRLGPPGRRVVEESLDKLEPYVRPWATWKLNGLRLDAAIDDLRAVGIIQMSREAVLETMRRSRESHGQARPIDLPDNPMAIIDVLALMDVLTWLWGDRTREIPYRHHDLIMTFAENSGGGFDPECAVQTWHQKTRGDLNAPYTVRFLYKGRVYRFGAENLGYEYDLDAVHRALNFALETAGRKERYIALDMGLPHFVFADPDAFIPIARKYALPISDDPDTALGRAKEFEREAIDPVKGQ